MATQVSKINWKKGEGKIHAANLPRIRWTPEPKENQGPTCQEGARTPGPLPPPAVGGKESSTED